MLLTGAFALIQVNCRRDADLARRRISAGSQIVQTPCGQIEYASAGAGPAVLAVHGAGGGYDQGLDIFQALASGGLRVIAMSRFGYLRTPLPADASAAAQADAHACLLDALHIRPAAVIGFSAGALSSMQFALRHPDRTSALVLLVPVAYPAHIRQKLGRLLPAQAPAETRFLFDIALQSDGLFWALPRLAPGFAARTLLATPAPLLENTSAEEYARVMQVLEHMLPIGPRRPGLINDAALTADVPRYELEKIAAPTLSLSMADDLFATYDGARYSAEHIPQARFIGYPTGGHLWVGHQREIMAEIAAFLR